MSELDVIDWGSAEARKRVTHLFRRAQIGRCVGSVVHDLNNILGVIMAYGELVGQDASLRPESQRMLADIGVSVRKASSLISQLSETSRQDAAGDKIVEPVQMVENVLALRRHTLKVEHILLETTYAQNVCVLSVDQVGIQQALLYVIENAIDALRPGHGGRLAIRVSESEATVDIAVKDSSEPIPEADRARIFEPFLTTKNEDHAGLGLAIARDALRQHGGDLTYDPERGFVLSLPKKSYAC